MRLCSRMATVFSLLVVCASCVAPISVRNSIYPAGWPIQAIEQKVTGLFAHASVVIEPGFDTCLETQSNVLAAERFACQSRGKKLTVVGDEELLASGSEVWLYRNASGIVLLERYFRPEIDHENCSARIVEVRGIDKCDAHNHDSDCAGSKQWPQPFFVDEDSIEGLKKYGKRQTKTVAGLSALCLSSRPGGFFFQSVCVANRAGPAEGMLLSYTELSDDFSSCGDVKVDKVLPNTYINASIFENPEFWLLQREPDPK